MLGKTEDKRRRGRQRMRWLDNTTNSTDMSLNKLPERRGKILRRGFKNTQKNYTKKIFMIQITMMV